MAKKVVKVTRLSAVSVFLFSAAAVIAIVFPDRVSGLPDFIDGYAPISQYLNFYQFSLEVITGDLALAAFAAGALLSAVVCAASIFGFMTKRRMGRRSISTAAFLLFLGYGIYTMSTSGRSLFEVVSVVDYGYYFVLASVAAATVAAYLSKRVPESRDKRDCFVCSSFKRNPQ
jgi:hypothetical protein